jgi:hypothetical protein
MLKSSSINMSEGSSKGDLAELGERLKTALEGVQERYETFIDDAQLYKGGKIDETSFFYKLGEYLLELTKANFLEAQFILELKNNLEKKEKDMHTNYLRASNEPKQSEAFVMNKPQNPLKRNCNSCGVEISPKGKFCRSCGKPQES